MGIWEPADKNHYLASKATYLAYKSTDLAAEATYLASKTADLAAKATDLAAVQSRDRPVALRSLASVPVLLLLPVQLSTHVEVRLQIKSIHQPQHHVKISRPG